MVGNLPGNHSGASNENNTCKENIDETDECCSSQARSTTTTKRNSNKFFKKKDKVSSANNEMHGFISSFNQLTSKNFTSATKTMLKHVTSNKCERANHCTVDDSEDVSAVLNEKATQDDSHSKYSEFFPLLNEWSERSLDLQFFCLTTERTHRCSEPMLVYPSPNRLQQCILSMPPVQPM